MRTLAAITPTLALLVAAVAAPALAADLTIQFPRRRPSGKDHGRPV